MNGEPTAGGEPSETVCLLDEAASLEAEFVPGAGMLCSSLRHRGVELLAQNAGVAAYAQLGKTMGIPLLYPWANRLADFQYSVGARTVVVPHDRSRIAVDPNGLPIHGVIGGRLPWALRKTPSAGSEAGPDARELAAHLSWGESDPAMYEVFPFRHDLDLEARLANGRLEITLTVDACGEDHVPLAFGFHPYVSLPGAPREQWLVELPQLRHLALDADQIPTGPDGVLGARSFLLADEEFDDGYDSVAEPARFSVAAAGRRITLEFSQGYPCAQVFAPKAKQFICFEPMAAPANSLRSGTGLQLLAPGERYAATFSVAVEDSH